MNLKDSFRMTLTSDKKLVAAIKASDEKAFKKLFLRYSPNLISFLYRRLKSEEIANDFLQEIFTRLWQNRYSLDPNKPVKIFLFRIANNLVIDYWRVKSSKEIYLNDIPHSGKHSRPISY